MVPVVIHTERTEMNVCRYLEAKRVPWVPSYDPAGGCDVVAGGEIQVEGFWLFLMKVEFGGGGFWGIGIVGIGICCGGLSGGENSVANGTFVILRFPSGRFELVQSTRGRVAAASGARNTAAAAALDSASCSAAASTRALAKSIRHFARIMSSSSLELEAKFPSLAARKDLFRLDHPAPFRPKSSSPSSETSDSASSELHFPCSRNDFQEKNSFPQFSQTLTLFNLLGFALN
nr:hypothetical protein CCACVL1_14336 [Ipomoea batatas]GME18191.1 hypothetical protein CCACVL1_14336 [Ipomoea batatas]